MSKKQHNLAVRLLRKLQLDYVRLERDVDGTYRYHAWKMPAVEGNGSGRISRRGVIRTKSPAHLLKCDE